ncbi:MAG TPA: CoA-binding protein [Thermoanaerobaculia bacterium]|nr:CoA-binding protein [Thermoanaerobaculia bacterium]
MSESETARVGRIVEDEKELAEIVRAMKVVAVIGMKGEEQGDEPAHEIPKLIQSKGRRVIPVNPKLTSTLGERAYARIDEVPEHADLVDVFRRPSAIPGHAEEILALPAERRPRVVWLQSGIHHGGAARRLNEAGIDVVQDRCLGVYASRYA